MHIVANIISKITNKANNKVHIENGAEEPKEELICGICLDPQIQPFKTSCSHSFCVSCLVHASTFKNVYNFPCPLCRETVVNIEDAMQLYKNDETNKTVKTISSFNPELYPIRADFEFVELECVQHMLVSAYKVITREEKWKFLHDYNVSEETGFMWARNIELNILMGKIEDNYGGHSGSSMGFIMRKMHYISKYGFDTFKNDWSRWN
jgi:hypothetical protein